MASRMTARLSSKYLAPSKYLTHIVRWLLASGFTDEKQINKKNRLSEVNLLKVIQ